MSPSTAAWAWIPIVLWAAFAQTVRNAAQRTLTATAGTLAATLVRFLYGLPVALVWLAVVKYGAHGALAGTVQESFSPVYAAWIVMGALTQLAATAFLLAAMAERNFIVAITWSKTELLQVALFSTLFLHELPTPMAMAAILIATVGVVLLSRPANGSVGGMGGRAALFGIASGACFALANVGYRGAALVLPAGVTPWVAGAWSVVWAQLLQSALLGGYLALRSPASLMVIARSWKISSIAGSMGALASAAWMTASAMRPVADVRTLGLVEVFFSYLVSHRIFAERLSRREQAGMALVAIGLVMVCLQL